MKRKMKLLDRYYSMPIIFDSIISISFCVVYNSLTLNQNLTLNDDLDLIKSFITDLLNTSISLAGFILASLTIIVTFKENLKTNNCNKSSSDFNNLNGLNLLLQSKHYRTIVKTFSTSVFILISGFVFLATTKFFIKKLPEYLWDYIIIVSVIIIALTTFRCIFLLYKIIALKID